MPYPSQVNVDTIVAKAREMIETEGVEALSLGKLAAALNIKAPSLYRYFDSKNALLRAINGDTAARLTGAIHTAAEGQQSLLSMALAYRAFALANPAAYLLAFSSASDELRPDEQILEQLALPLQALLASVVGEAESLAALRGLWALIHGFVSLELAGQMRRGGDLEATFTHVVETFARGLYTDNGAA